MKTRTTLTASIAALALAGTMGGLAAHSAAIAGDREITKSEKIAGKAFAKAQNAFGKADYADAVRFAEAAVAARPALSDYRLLLGQSYLMSGRFVSARQAFTDVLTMDGTNGRAALNLALAEIATGDFAEARKMLDAHADGMSVADRGLAIALAGDPAAAVELLVPAVRDQNADAKTRQNLALALALAGRWADARTVASVDLDPAQVQNRILQWAAIAQPVNAADQVAAVLGVRAAADAGQPVALALTSPAAVSDAAPVAVADVPAVASDEPIAADPAPASVADNAVPAPEITVADGAPTVSFAARQEVVQPLPAAVAARKPTVVAKASRTAKPVAVAKKAVASVRPVAPAPRTPAKGNYFIQIGAFPNAAVAKDAWSRATRRYAAFAGHTPQGTAVTGKTGSFYRLAVGGFARPDAVSLCQGFKAKGGACFVRQSTGDAVATWVRPGVKLASR